MQTTVVLEKFGHGARLMMSLVASFAPISPLPLPFSRRFTTLPFAAASRGGHGGSSFQALAEWRSGEGWYGTLVKVIGAPRVSVHACVCVGVCAVCVCVCACVLCVLCVCLFLAASLWQRVRYPAMGST